MGEVQQMHWMHYHLQGVGHVVLGPRCIGSTTIFRGLAIWCWGLSALDALPSSGGWPSGVGSSVVPEVVVSAVFAHPCAYGFGMFWKSIYIYICCNHPVEYKLMTCPLKLWYLSHRHSYDWQGSIMLRWRKPINTSILQCV